MKTTPSKIYRLKALASILLVIIPLGRLSWEMYWSDSEMWAATVARGLFTHWSEAAYILKPLFYAPLWFSFQVAEQFQLWPMQTARALFALNAALIVLMSYVLARRSRPSQSLVPLLVVMLFGTSALYLERIHNVRSDLMICSLILCSMLLLTRAKTFWWGLIPALLAPLVSLNALFFFPFLIPVLPETQAKGPLFDRSKNLILAVAVLLLVSILILGSFGMSWSFFKQSFLESASGLSYFHPKRFEHVLRWIQKDPHVFLLIAVKLAHDIYVRLKNVSISPTVFKGMGYWALALILLHPNRLPFFLVALLPFLLLWALELPALYSLLAKKFEHKPFPARLLFMVAISAVVSRSSTHAVPLLTQHNNKEQIRVMTGLSQMIPRENFTIWDPVGILPYHSTYLWYLGPGQEEENKHIAQVLASARPSMVIVTQRFAWIADLPEASLEDYAEWANGIYIANAKIDLQGVEAYTRDEFLGKLQVAFGGLSQKEWEFDVYTMNEARDKSGVEVIDIEGKRTTLGSTNLLSLLYVDYLSFKPESKWLKIDVKPMPKIENLPALDELFRFDAHL